jgi:hypothetical protein
MSRLERPDSGSKNPAKKFIEWKSELKCFSYYDKEVADQLAQEGKTPEEIKEGANIMIPTPFKVLFLEHYHAVKGWHDPSASGIFSNEVFLIGSEPLTVKSYKGGEIVSGLYKDNKDKIKNAGGTYHRIIYAMLEDGTLVNLCLKGACVGGIKKEKAVDKQDHLGYSDFMQQNSNKLEYQWLVFGEAHSGKSGKVNFSIPDFSVGERISKEVDEMANEAVEELQAYVKDRTGKKNEEETDERKNSEVNKYEDEEVDLNEIDI